MYVDEKNPAVAESRMSMREKALAVGFSLLVIGAVLWPVRENWQSDSRDSFPLSHYPMFSKQRGDEVRVTSIVGIDREGNEYRIPNHYAGKGGMNQQRKQIARQVLNGTATQLCLRVAKRLASRDEPRYQDLVAVAIVSGTFLIDDYFDRPHRPADYEIEAVCRIRREES